jgi:hypothetical protein
MRRKREMYGILKKITSKRIRIANELARNRPYAINFQKDSSIKIVIQIKTRRNTV